MERNNQLESEVADLKSRLDEKDDIIENAIGGSGNDTITGNSADNEIVALDTFCELKHCVATGFC